MKRLAVLFVTLIVVALDWAALHDIVKANEPNLVGEYAAVIASVPIVNVLLSFVLRGKSKKAYLA